MTLITDLTAGGALSGLEQVHARVGGNSRRFYLPAWQLLGGSYTATGIWDQSNDGTVSSVTFTGLAGAQDVLLIQRLVTQSVSGSSRVRLSDDNGSSYYSTSGNYVLISNLGAESNASDGGLLHDTNATAARSGVMLISSLSLSGVPKVLHSYTRQSGLRTILFVAGSFPAINAVEITPHNGGNFTGGVIYCLARGLSTT